MIESIFPDSSVGKESACNVGDLGSIPGLGRSPGEWEGYPLQYCGLENSKDCIVHGVTKSQTRVNDFHSSGFTDAFLFIKLPIGHLSPYRSDQIRSVAQSCPTLCDPMNHSTPGLPVHHQLPEFTQTHAHRVSDAIQPSHPLSSPSPPAPKSLPASGSFPMSQLFA